MADTSGPMLDRALTSTQDDAAAWYPRFVKKILMSLTVPAFHQTGQSHQQEHTALKNVITVQIARPQWQLHFHLITSVECCLFLVRSIGGCYSFVDPNPFFQNCVNDEYL